MISNKKIYVFLTLMLCLFNFRCSMNANSERLKQEKARIEEKKKNFENLSQAIKTNQLKKNSLSEDILNEYGKPDDVFRSGSVVSHFEIWTYEEILEQDSEGWGWNPVKLYFDNDKLVNWKY